MSKNLNRKIILEFIEYIIVFILSNTYLIYFLLGEATDQISATRRRPPV